MLGGVVLGGSVRDLGWIRATTSRSTPPASPIAGPTRTGRARSTCRSRSTAWSIEPGDLVLGDDDGLLCVPFDAAASLYDAARAKHEAEEKTLASTQAGRLDPKTWVDEALKRLGCEGV
jgi:regulator of RNase E activity RraA